MRREKPELLIPASSLEVLKTAVIGDSVPPIAIEMFGECDSLTEIRIGLGVKSILDGAFSGCNKLQGVYIKDIQQWCHMEIGYYDENPLSYARKLYLNNLLVTNLEIPEGVEAISKYAFYGCSSIETITFPNSLTAIGDWAFRSCTSLKSIELGESINKLGDFLFADCTSLTDVDLKASVSLSSGVFAGCSSLSNVSVANI